MPGSSSRSFLRSLWLPSHPAPKTKGSAPDRRQRCAISSWQGTGYRRVGPPPWKGPSVEDISRRKRCSAPKGSPGKSLSPTSPLQDSCASCAARNHQRTRVPLEVGVNSRCRELLRRVGECNFVLIRGIRGGFYWPRIPRISRKRSLPLGSRWFEIRFFTLSGCAA